MLSDTEIARLETILFDDQWPEGAMDYFGFHGAACAAAIGPVTTAPETLFAVVTAQDPARVTEAPQDFRAPAEKLDKLIRQTLEQGDAVELPEPDDGSVSDALENWCAGFIDTFLLQEDDWLADHEEDVANLLVPIMALSNLFDDEDFQKIRKDPQLAEQMADQIPDALTDLYLLFHTP